MRGHRFAVWPLLLWSTGCLDARILKHPEVEGAQSIVYVQGLSGPNPRGVILPADQPPTLLTADEDVLAFAYAWVPRGVIAYGEPFDVDDLTSTQPLPDPIATYQASPENSEFRPIETTTGLHGRIRLPLPDIGRCTESEGCLSEEGLIRCEVPCPAQEPLPPRPVRFECPTDWRSVPGPAGLSLCEPEVHETQACGPEQWQGYGPDCLPLGDCAPGGDPWPPIPPGNGALIYVDMSAAPGGDGSRARPLVHILTAARTPQARVLLAPGEYVAPVFDAQNVQVHARCPARTRLRSNPRIRILSRGVQLTGVGIDGTSTGIVVASGASLSLKSVEISADDRGLELHGDLIAEQLKLRADVGLLIEAGRTELTGIDHVGVEAIRCMTGQFKVEDMRAIGIGEGTAAFSTQGCNQADFERVHIQGHQAPGILLMQRPYDVSIVDTNFRNLGASAIETARGETSTVTSHINLQRLYAEDMGRSAIKVWSVDLAASQIVVHNAQSTSVDLRQGREGPGRMQIDSLWVTLNTMQENQLVRVGQVSNALGDVTVQGSNWVLEHSTRPKSNGGVLKVTEDGVLTLDQAYISAGKSVAIDIACGDAEFSDLTISGAISGAILSQPLSRMSLRRVNVLGPTDDMDLRLGGLLLQKYRSCTNAVHILEDVNFEACPGCDIAILTLEGAVMEAKRVAARGYNIGIDASRGGAIEIRGGILDSNRVGLQLDTNANPYEMLRGVRLNNRVDIIQPNNDG